MCNEIRELTKRDRTAIVSNFPNQIYSRNKIPAWVNKTCDNALQKLKSYGMLLPYACQEIIGLGAGSDFKIVKNGTLIHASANNSTGCIALLYGEDRAWLVAAWDSKTGTPQPFPSVGTPIRIPTTPAQLEEAQKRQQETLLEAKKELERMKQEDSLQLVTGILIISATFFLLAWFSN